VDLRFSGELVYWRGPSPYHFVEMPTRESAEIQAASRHLTYGWGCIPVSAEIGGTRFTTSLFPKGGRYLVPVKVAVRRAEDLELGDTVGVVVHAGPAAV
jgi:hypothetical protein